jgi:phosphoribosylformylglycinamidine synthase
MSLLFPKGRKLERMVKSRKPVLIPFDPHTSLVEEYPQIPEHDLIRKAIERVFEMPAVGSKSFLITIGDRTVGGMTVRDQMVGPWQTPVADVAVTITSLNKGDHIKTGEAMSMGEKPTLALVSPAASSRMAVAESLLNLAAAHILRGKEGDLARVRLSANWMAAVNHPGEGAALYEAVQAIGMELCPKLGISIPVGKDSTSMKASWKDASGEAKSVTAPTTVVISAFAPVANVRDTWTPALRRLEDVGETVLMYVDLAEGHQALGGSALAQSLGQLGDEVPDVRNADLILDYFDAISQMHETGVVLAYHDISDGGLLTAVAEMMFAGRCGAEIMIDTFAKSSSVKDVMAALFNEELGAIFQVRKSDERKFISCFSTSGPPKGVVRKIGRVPAATKQQLAIRYDQTPMLHMDRAEMQKLWSTTSYKMQRIRDNIDCADAEFENINDDRDPGLSYKLTFEPKDFVVPIKSQITSFLLPNTRPRVAILREQGVNGHAEMAFAFMAAGFDAVDVHMTDLLDKVPLSNFVGIAACGGFSYGDVLGAGAGWAKSILLHEDVRAEFQRFFARPETFALGVCNGCQMLTRIAELIPGTSHWPLFLENQSQQFEGRVSMVKIQDNPKNPSVFFHGMDGSSLPIAVSHGEGRANFRRQSDLEAMNADSLIPIRYTDNRGNVTNRYPFNPNGSPEGIAGVRSLDGRVLAMMPHPERTIMADVGSYIPTSQVEQWGEFGPWLRMFNSARRWVG